MTTEEQGVIGVDLGTTRSTISYWDDTSLSPVPVRLEGSTSTYISSVAYITALENGKPKFVVGQKALLHLSQDGFEPANLLSQPKRLRGKRYCLFFILLFFLPFSFY
jgi:molecular chaperone DnaK (HSP70)